MAILDIKKKDNIFYTIIDNKRKDENLKKKNA